MVRWTTCWTFVPLCQKHLAIDFIQQGFMFTVGLTQVTWLLLCLSFDITHTAHRETNRLTNKYISTLPVMCSQQLSVLHWINHSLILKIQRSAISFLFKNLSSAEVTYQLIRFNKTKPFLWNTENTDKNHVNEQKTHTYHTKRSRCN